MNGATLFRRNGPAWRFEWEAGSLVHRTRRGNVYLILIGLRIGKPFWIGRETSRGSTVFTAEADIGAEYVQFDNGSEFWFGGKQNDKA